MEPAIMGITGVPGFEALGKHIGIKRKRKDFAVISSTKPCTAAMTVTTNKARAAPLTVNLDHIKDGKAQAVIINSGVANACTGSKGLEDAYHTAALGASALGINAKDVLVLSTGRIGDFLPMEKISSGISTIKGELSSSKQAGTDAAEAIMTTDTKMKQAAVRVGKATIAGMAKGAGMIHPNMATMLAIIATDAKVPTGALQRCLTTAVESSFNMISVDNDTSTNDSVIVLANGLAGPVDISEFQEGLSYVCLELAKMIAADGEGATKLIETTVTGAASVDDARKAAKAVISSPLVKSAAFGNDPNWGRIVAAAGYSGCKMRPEKVSVTIQGTTVVRDGMSARFNPNHVSELMKSPKLIITVDLGIGKGTATAYGCDLTYEYVKINADYHT
jgi:glutamate N-acetyltransferase/amino-acid N-acetyltransferase